MHERQPKNSPLDTILYEIDMLRHCAQALPGKQAQKERTGSDADQFEYYMCIEDFLLHLRNLIAFFTNQRDKKTDLGINAPDQWADRKIEQRAYSDLMKTVKEINDRHGMVHSSCYDQISKYLQHCTTFRHEGARSWDIERIFAEIDPVLTEFEKRFVRATSKMPELILIPGERGATTATVRTSVIMVEAPKKI